MLQEAMPRKAVEALEGQVRNLAERVDQTRHAGADGAALTGIERGLAEVRDALRGLTPAENLIGVDQAVQQLSQKIDLIAGNTQDPAALKQLEGSILAMRGIVSHVASNDALAKLSDEVRALAGKVDQAAGAGGASSVLSALESRIATLADALEARNQGGQAAPHEIEAVVKGLIDKIERIQLTPATRRRSDISRTVSPSWSRSSTPPTPGSITSRRSSAGSPSCYPSRAPACPEPRARAGGALPPEVDVLSRDLADLRQTEKKTQDALEIVHGTLGHVVDRLAMIETDMRGKPRRDAAPAKPAAPSPSPRR